MPESENKTVLPVLIGPTASGKTSAGIIIAEALGCEIVSADSRQIYRGMATGSGAPSAPELARIRHHFIGILEPHIRISAGEYARLARQVIPEIIDRGKLPLVVGGSGLYIRALVDGLAPLPTPDPELRREIEHRIEMQGMAAMIEELRIVDPEYAEKVGLRDKKRLLRALEVWETTGRPFSEWHGEQPVEPWCLPLFFGVNRPRLALHSLIEARVEQMLESGWIDEAQTLALRYGGMDKLPPTVTEAVGYNEIISYLRNEISLVEAKERIIISTRQYAKRQITWFRADKRIEWFDGSGEDAVQEWAGWIINRLNEG